MNIQKQARYLIKKFNFNKDLQKFGEAHLVGSVVLRTMLKRDIDYQIYVKNPTLKLANDVKNMLLEKGFEVVLIKDLKAIGKILITTEYFLKGERWTVDITFATKGKSKERDSFLFLQEAKNKLNNENRKAIIDLKNIFKEKGLLHNTMSYYIYRAVIDEGVKDEKGMMGYLRKNKFKLNQFKKIKNNMKIDKSKLKIRLAKKGDIEFITNIYMEFSDYHHKLNPKYWAKPNKLLIKSFKKNVLEKRIGKKDSRILIIEIDKAVVGYFSAYYTKSPSVINYKKIGHINQVFINNKFRGCGVGKLAIDNILKWFKNNKIQIVELNVDIENKVGIKYWKKMGFKESGVKMSRLI